MSGSRPSPPTATTEAAGADHAVVDAPVVARRRAAPRRAVLPPGARPEAQVALTLRLGLRRADGGDRRRVPRLDADDGGPPDPGQAAHRRRRDEGIELPDDVAVEERMPAVRRTVHLAYSMGHTATAGAALRDDDLAAHAVRLARALHELRPGDTECAGPAWRWCCSPRRGPPGGSPPTGSQVAARRRRSHARGIGELIAEGLAIVDRRRRGERSARSALQAAIAAEHARAADVRRRPTGAGSSTTTTPCCAPSRAPTIAIGRCVAIAYRVGPAAGLADLDEVLDVGGSRRLPVRPRGPGATLLEPPRSAGRGGGGRGWPRPGPRAPMPSDRGSSIVRSPCTARRPLASLAPRGTADGVTVLAARPASTSQTSEHLTRHP